MRYETIAVENELGECAVIRKSDFDPKKHKRFRKKAKSEDDPDPPESEEQAPEERTVFGDYRIEGKGGGYKNVIHVPTAEVQNEKGLKPDDAIALAQKLAAKESN